MALADLVTRARRYRGQLSVATHQWQHDRCGEVEFIHINKTGGSSVEQALGLPFSHQTAAMRVARLGVEEWNRRYSFTFVRNPWDRLVSQYHYRKSRGRLRRDVDFRTWVRSTILDRDVELMGWDVMFMSQLARITGPAGDLLVDDIYQFERFDADFRRLCHRLGIEAALGHTKPSSHAHYSQYYDAETAAIVAKVFEQDVDYFGYRLTDENA